MGPTATSHTVTVYNYWVPDGSSDPYRHISTAKAPLSTIRDRLQLEPLMSTGEDVEREALDDEGHYQRRATGWGVLD